MCEKSAEKGSEVLGQNRPNLTVDQEVRTLLI